MAVILGNFRVASISVTAESQNDGLCSQTLPPQGSQPGSLQSVMYGRSSVLRQILGVHYNGFFDPVYALSF